VFFETGATLPGDLGLIPIAEALKSATSRTGGKSNVIARGPEPRSPGISRARSRIGPGYLATVSEKRRYIHARYVAALTEFWRCHRNAAGVLHFCGLGYSCPGDQPRPKGEATSDHWIDLEQLTFEPTFQKCVRDAFSPMGLMLDLGRDGARRDRAKREDLRDQ
jgi:hypothetical protein